MSGDEVDEASSYGSGHSSGAFMEASTVAVPASGGEDMAALLGGIAQLARGQALLLDRLSCLERIVGTVQFDMTWVRDDTKSVHEAMDRFADFVCDFQDEAIEVQRLKDQVSLDGSPRQAWKGKEVVVDLPRGPSVSTSLGERQFEPYDAADWSAAQIDGGNYTQETEMFAENHDTHTRPLALIDTGRREWGYESVPSPDMGSPPCQQARMSIEMEPLEEESQQFEMSCQSTQMPTPATAPTMWTDFATAVRDWRAPTVVEVGGREGWVSAKKGRWDLTVHGKENVNPVGAQMVEEHGNLNLNLLPEKEGPPAITRGMGDVATDARITSARKNVASGAWRGTTVGRRPAAVQPRFHTTVSVA